MTDSQIYDALRKGEEYLGIDRIRLLESKIREFKSIGIVAENAMQSQALIQLKNNYCQRKRCLSCRFGHVLLNRG